MLSCTLQVAVNKARLYPDVVKLHLTDAQLCVTCDTIHNGPECPVCSSTSFIDLRSVLGSNLD